MASILENKRLVLGVTGGIAAYKAAELLRLLTGAGASVRVVMTRSARWFVGKTTFEALSQQPVFCDLFDEGGEGAIRHIDWAQEADAVIVAPATANIVGKLANGIADDALSTFLMAVTAPKILCPAMNTHMLMSPAVQRNLERLREDGVTIVDPDAGDLACGTIGPGRLPDPAVIFDRVAHRLTPKDFAGITVLVTAGPTREYFDPLRFISNPSSGKMGYAAARAAEHRGATVVLVSGPTALKPPPNVETVFVETARQMAEAVLDRAGDARVVVKTAAVGDYAPADRKAQKIKKGEATLSLTLEKTEDILRALGNRKSDHQILVGFAAETEALEQNATAKLREKNLDMIAGNLLNEPDAGFGADTNRVTLFFRDGRKEALPVMDKDEVAHALLDRIRMLMKT
ncbi:MAG: bifunctional phosphopantothenoylcysteine decarboxylase/phosphopantothenate--cysteine ligase CoaBC [Desulfobacterales bacterium]|jgi:phosphopantothenoylcysteine decarboxylase/phosphopantothenate--cysteine ligase